MVNSALPLPEGWGFLVEEASLRSGALERVFDALTLPREALYGFALGCLREGFAAADAAGVPTPPAGRDGVRALGRWLGDQLSEKRWQGATRAAWEAMATLEAQQSEVAALPGEVAAQPAAQPAASTSWRAETAYQLARAVAWSGVAQVQEAAEMAAWCTAKALVELALHTPAPEAPPSHLSMSYNDHWLRLRQRQCHHLAAAAIACLQDQRAILLTTLQRRAHRSQDAIARMRHVLWDALYE